MKSLYTSLAFAMAAAATSANAYANIPPPLPMTDKIEGTYSARCAAVLMIYDEKLGTRSPTRDSATNYYETKAASLLKDETQSVFAQVSKEETAPFRNGTLTTPEAIAFVRRVKNCIEGANIIEHLYK